MQPLVIEYLIEGRLKGYTFTSPTNGYSDAALKSIWRNAMPRGQGWNAERYAGAHALKCFPLDERLLALAEVTVTDQRDESGRRGIRRAEIHVMHAEHCAAALRQRLRSYDPTTCDHLARLPNPRQWGQIVDRLLPVLGRDKQLVLTRPYAHDTWQVMEALVVKLALSLQVGLKRYHGVIPFTSLALDPREESPIVAVPADSIGKVANLTPVEIS